MKAIRKAIAAAALAALSALAVGAQTAPAQRPATPAPDASQGAAIAEGKFAIINTDAFGDPKDGIKRLVAAFQTVDREFKPRRDEVQQMQARYDALVKEISDTKGVTDRKTIAAKADQAEQLKTEIERKQQDGQKALEKRAHELTDPIYADIGNALQTFANQRGLWVVFDMSKMRGVVMVVNDSVDITRAFIADYNQRNPAATASTSGPGNQ